MHQPSVAIFPNPDKPEPNKLYFHPDGIRRIPSGLFLILLPFLQELHI